MTQETLRCQVPVAMLAPGIFPKRVCGLPLVPTEGPCVTCGHDDSEHTVGRANGEPYCAECFGGSADDWNHNDAHPYQPPVSCPVHSAAPDRGEA